jgi:hypothetical protein
VGKTTIAIDLALALARETDARVALVDLDLQLGNIAGLLGIRRSGDVADALAPAILLDPGRLRSQLGCAPPGIDVLVAPSPDRRGAVDLTRLPLLLQRLSHLYDYVIADTAPVPAESALAALGAATTAVLVTTPAIPGRSSASPQPVSLPIPLDRVRVVLNRAVGSARAAKPAETLGRPVDWRIGESRTAADVTKMARALAGLEVGPREPAQRGTLRESAARWASSWVARGRALTIAHALPRPTRRLAVGAAGTALGAVSLATIWSYWPPADSLGALGAHAAAPTLAAATAQLTVTARTGQSSVELLLATPTMRAPSATAVPTAPAPEATPTMPPPTATTRPATPTSIPTAIPPTPVPTSAPPRSGVQAVVLDERFGDNRRGWPSAVGSTAWVADGVYHLAARQPGRFVAVRAPLSGPIGDGRVSATFRKTGGPPGGGYGVIVRDAGEHAGDGVDQKGRYYVFEVGDRGEIGAWRRENDRWIDLLPWTRSDKVRPGLAANTLMVRTSGSRMTLFVNESEVVTFEDATMRDGAVGVFVGGDLNEVALERLHIEEGG